MSGALHRCESVLPRGLFVAVALFVASAAGAEEGDSLSMRNAVGQANQAIQAEVLKASVAKKAILEGLATYRAQSRLLDQATTAQQNMQQSDQVCQTMAAQDALATGASRARARVIRDQRQAAPPVSRSTTAIAAVESMHRASNESFCAEHEVARGVCRATASAKYSNLAGADQNAMFLFQTRNGGDTYEGTAESGQVEAANAYIARVVGGGIPTESVRLQGSKAYASNPQARAYIELARRYEAFLSMASYSLSSIKGTRIPAQ